MATSSKHQPHEQYKILKEAGWLKKHTHLDKPFEEYKASDEHEMNGVFNDYLMPPQHDMGGQTEIEKAEGNPEVMPKEKPVLRKGKK